MKILLAPSESKNAEIRIPNDIKEQEKRGEFFRKIDGILDLENSRFKKLENFKKTMLDKLFVKNGADEPQIRLGSFKGKWNSRILGDICEYKTSNLTTSNKVNEDSNTKIESTVRHIFAKKNLNEVFNNAKNENICSLNNNNKYTTKENTTDNKDSISQDFLISSPPKKVINKKLFECSGSTMFKSTSAKSSQKKKRRFRKNYEQLQKLSLFYSENKHWSKNQIKKISEETGLKENKVYKWLWDQKNKEYRNAKFIVNK